MTEDFDAKRSEILEGGESIQLADLKKSVRKVALVGDINSSDSDPVSDVKRTQTQQELRQIVQKGGRKTLVREKDEKAIPDDKETEETESFWRGVQKYWATLAEAYKEARENKDTRVVSPYNAPANLQRITSAAKMDGNYPHTSSSTTIADVLVNGDTNYNTTPKELRASSGIIYNNSDFFYTLKCAAHNNFVLPVMDSWVGDGREGLLRQTVRFFLTIPVAIFGVVKTVLKGIEAALRYMVTPLTDLHRYTWGLGMKAADYEPNKLYGFSNAEVVESIKIKQITLDGTPAEQVNLADILDRRALLKALTEKSPLTASQQRTFDRVKAEIKTGMIAENQSPAPLDNEIFAEEAVLKALQHQKLSIPETKNDLDKSKTRSRLWQILNIPVNGLVKKPIDLVGHTLHYFEKSMSEFFGAIATFARYGWTKAGRYEAALKFRAARNAAGNLIVPGILAAAFATAGIYAPQQLTELATGALIHGGGTAALVGNVFATFGFMLTLVLAAYTAQLISSKIAQSLIVRESAQLAKEKEQAQVEQEKGTVVDLTGSKNSLTVNLEKNDAKAFADSEEQATLGRLRRTFEKQSGINGKFFQNIMKSWGSLPAETGILKDNALYVTGERFKQAAKSSQAICKTLSVRITNAGTLAEFETLKTQYELESSTLKENLEGVRSVIGEVMEIQREKMEKGKLDSVEQNVPGALGVIPFSSVESGLVTLTGNELSDQKASSPDAVSKSEVGDGDSPQSIMPRKRSTSNPILFGADSPLISRASREENATPSLQQDAGIPDTESSSSPGMELTSVK